MRNGLMILLGVLATLAAEATLAQEETLSQEEAKALIVEDAYGKTSSARSERDFSEIISLCERGLQVDVGEATKDYGKKLLSWAFNRRGQIRLDNRRLEAAMADFAASVEHDPSRHLAYHNRGYGYAIQGKFEEALADFTKTVELKPEFAKGYINRGELYSVAGRWSEAIEDYTKALELQPDDDELYTSRGHAYYQTENYAAAVRDYNASLRLNPRSNETLVLRGDALFEAGSLEAAARDYRLAVSRAPEFSRAYLSSAWMMATSSNEQFRNAEQGLASAERALELLGDDNDEIRHRYLMVLAAAQANAGQFEQAVESMQEALEIAPEGFQAEYQAMLKSFQNQQPHRSGASPEANTASD